MENCASIVGKVCMVDHFFSGPLEKKYSHDFVTLCLESHWLSISRFYSFSLPGLASFISFRIIIVIIIIYSLYLLITQGESFSSFNLSAIFFLSYFAAAVVVVLIEFR